MNSIIKNLDLKANGLWLPISIVLILLLYILIMSKKEINWREVYITIGVIGLLTWISDNIFAGFFDLVDFGHPKLSGIGELLTYSFIPSSLAVIYLNYLNKSNKWRLVIIFVVISFLIEWAVAKVGFMELKRWNHLLSIPIFFIVYSYFLPLHFKIIKCSKDE